MKLAETVTFGGSGLDRAAALRGDADALAEARAGADVLLLWRGKPAFAGQGRTKLLRLSADHQLVQDTPLILLGREDTGRAIFAAELRGWRPEGLDEAVLGSFFDPTEYSHPDIKEPHVFAELRGVMTQLTARDAEMASTARALFNWHRSHRFCAACGEPSEMCLAGWQRGCASCGAQHFPRTDPAVIMLITHGDDVLLGRSPGWPEGMYSCLAGFVEPGETIEAAVRREVLEETQIEVGAVRYLASQPWAYPNSLMFGCAGEALTRQITIDPIEIEEAIWLSRSELVQAFAGQHPKVKPARKGAIAHFLLWNWLADRLD